MRRAMDGRGDTRRGGWRTAGPLLALVLLLGACSTAWERPAVGSPSVGLASWYGGKFHGRRTASGAVFDQNGHTAAHRTLPFGTRVRVTNLANGRSIVLVITDRGPYVRGRIIDISRRAAEHLGFVRVGLARVRVEVVQLGRG